MLALLCRQKVVQEVGARPLGHQLAPRGGEGRGGGVTARARRGRWPRQKDACQGAHGHCCRPSPTRAAPGCRAMARCGASSTHPACPPAPAARPPPPARARCTAPALTRPPPLRLGRWTGPPRRPPRAPLQAGRGGAIDTCPPLCRRPGGAPSPPPHPPASARRQPTNSRAAGARMVRCTLPLRVRRVALGCPLALSARRQCVRQRMGGARANATLRGRPAAPWAA